MLRSKKQDAWEQADFSLGLKKLPLGNALWCASFSDKGLAHFTLLSTEKVKRPPLSARSEKRLNELKKKLGARLRGEQADYAWDEFDVAGGKFHRAIWQAMHAIPFGETRTYGEVAVEAGSPLAFRACGQACGANPIVLFIPCHRVVSATGIGGFSSGLELKRTLLGLEKKEKTTARR